jgi:hypothetical protein
MVAAPTLRLAVVAAAACGEVLATTAVVSTGGIMIATPQATGDMTGEEVITMVVADLM